MEDDLPKHEKSTRALAYAHRNATRVKESTIVIAIVRLAKVCEERLQLGANPIKLLSSNAGYLYSYLPSISTHVL